MKSYTDINQSKKLAEILPIDSADMGYAGEEEDSICCGFGDVEQELYTDYGDGHPCWSLAALLNILPDRTCVYKKTYKDGRVKYKGVVEGCKELILKDNPIDTCYEMILKLHEQKIL